MRENDIPANAMHRPEVLNGIAYDEATGELWITGKRWPKVCWCPMRYLMRFVCVEVAHDAPALVR
jgi:hypothetical protein